MSIRKLNDDSQPEKKQKILSFSNSHYLKNDVIIGDISAYVKILNHLNQFICFKF